MNEILVARKPFEAYLISSALSTSVMTNGTSAAVQRRVDVEHQLDARFGSRVPITTRSGCMKSSIAEPSRRNSGLRDHGELVLAAGPLAHDLLDHLAGADRHRALGDDDLVAVQVLADRLGHLRG